VGVAASPLSPDQVMHRSRRSCTPAGSSLPSVDLDAARHGLMHFLQGQRQHAVIQRRADLLLVAWVRESSMSAGLKPMS
jgi:hypothetical protein